MAVSDRIPWERVDGESDSAVRAFDCYRLLGPNRTLPDAWLVYVGKLRKHPKSPKRAPQAPGYFKAWCNKFGWVARAQAWDEEMRLAFRDQELDRELEERAREQEEDMAARRRRRATRHEAEAVAGRVFHSLLAEIVDHAALDKLKFADKLFHAPRMSIVMTSALRQARLEEGKSTENVQLGMEERLAALIGQVIRSYVPREHWDEAAEKIVELVAGENGKLTGIG